MIRHTIKKSGFGRDFVSAASMPNFAARGSPGRKTRSDVRTELIEGRWIRESHFPSKLQTCKKERFWVIERMNVGSGLVEVRKWWVGWKSLAAGLAFDLYMSGNAGKARLRRFARKRTVAANQLDLSRRDYTQTALDSRSLNGTPKFSLQRNFLTVERDAVDRGATQEHRRYLLFLLIWLPGAAETTQPLSSLWTDI